MAAITEDAELKDLKQKLEKAKATFEKIDKEVPNDLTYHIQQMEMHIARLKDAIESNDPKKKIDSIGNHGEIQWSLNKIKDLLEKFEYAVKDVKSLEEDIESYEEDLKYEQRNKKASVISKAMQKLSSQI